MLAKRLVPEAEAQQAQGHASSSGRLRTISGTESDPAFTKAMSPPRAARAGPAAAHLVQHPVEGARVLLQHRGAAGGEGGGASIVLLMPPPTPCALVQGAPRPPGHRA